MLRYPLWFAVPLIGLGQACSGNSGVDAGSAGGNRHTPCASCTQGGTSQDAEAGQGGDAGTSGARDLTADGGESGEGGAAGDTSSPDVRISEVSFWQALRVPLEVNGAPVLPNAPIVSNKDAILRVYVAPSVRFRARQLAVQLQFGLPGASAPYSSQKLIRAASEHADFGSTFNFPIDAQQVLSGSSYAVRLLDGASGPELDHYPASAPEALITSTAGALNVVVVPLVVGGVMPDVSSDKIAIFRERVLSMYPLADLNITTHEPVLSAVAVGPSSGWDALLDSLYALRAHDAPPANVFYYGMFTPTATFGAYCVTDCTVGYSTVTDAADVADRGSVGLGIFSDGSNSDAPDTMAHELGHALGRDHAPCDVSKADSGPFPYAGGKIGVWGFDSLNHLLLDPQIYGDVMGYCTPDWISDFTYRALFTRIAAVNAELGRASAKALNPKGDTFRRVLVHHVGSAALPLPTW